MLDLVAIILKTNWTVLFNLVQFNILILILYNINTNTVYQTIRQVGLIALNLVQVYTTIVI